MTRLAPSTLWIVFFALVLPATASATEDAPYLAAEHAPEREEGSESVDGYAWQVLAVDAAVMGGGALAGARKVPAGLFVAGGPGVHLAHGQTLAAFRGMGLRLGPPALAAAFSFIRDGGPFAGVFVWAPDFEEWWDDVKRRAWRAAVVGAGIGAAVDFALTTALGPIDSDNRERTSRAIWPTFDIGGGGEVSMGVGGRF